MSLIRISEGKKKELVNIEIITAESFPVLMIYELTISSSKKNPNPGNERNCIVRHIMKKLEKNRKSLKLLD